MTWTAGVGNRILPVARDLPMASAASLTTCESSVRGCPNWQCGFANSLHGCHVLAAVSTMPSTPASDYSL
jgi:hypothetical protein